MKIPLLLPLILLLALALRVPGWFSADEKSESRLFEAGEYQQARVAASLIRSWDAGAVAKWEAESADDVPRGFGIQMGAIAYVLHRAGGMTIDAASVILIGRVLSTFYSLLLIGLVYGIGLHLFHSRLAALLGALLMALFDLDVSYSHQALPTVAYAFWAYTAVFLMVLFYDYFPGKKPAGEPGWNLNLSIPLAAAGALTVQLDFLPIVVAAAILLRLFARKKLPLRSTVGYAGSFFAFFVICFYLITLFDFGWADVRHTFSALVRNHYDVIAGDRHWLLNPPVYLLAVTAGSSLLVMIVFAIALVSLVGRGKAFPGQVALRWWLFFLLLEFLLLWILDAPLVRRAHVFLPFVAVVAGRGLAGVLRGDPRRPAWQRYSGAALVITYTLALTLSSQYNAWFDTRREARDLLGSRYAGEAVYYSPGAWMPGMPAGVEQEAAGVLVLHESFYGRYWKSFATPFRRAPECCRQVYRCRSEAECQLVQSLLRDGDNGYERVYAAATRSVMPERVLFKRWFGTFEPFLGDVLIFRKKTP